MVRPQSWKPLSPIEISEIAYWRNQPLATDDLPEKEAPDANRKAPQANREKASAR